MGTMEAGGNGATPEERLAAAGIVLPEAAAPVANYVPVVRTGSLLVVSGQLPLRDGRLLLLGKLGGAVSVEQGAEAARLCMVNVLAQLSVFTGGALRRIRRVVRLGGFIACEPSFIQHAAVMNGASDFAVLAFGDDGRHARSTIGVPSLPLDAPVEVEGMFELADGF